jgi:hypothetical protein
MRTCTKCGETKNLLDFYKNTNGGKDGLSSHCKMCINIKRSEYNHLNKEKINDKRRIYQKLHSKEIYDRFKIKKNSNEVIKKIIVENHKVAVKKYRELHIQEIKERDKIKRQTLDYKIKRRNYDKKLRTTNHAYRLNKNFQRNILLSLKSNKEGKRWESLVGYTIKDLVSHLEQKFTEGMTWENYGLFGWHIDHIKPISWFKISYYSDEAFRECWSLKNLQPMWCNENDSKGNRYCGNYRSNI